MQVHCCECTQANINLGWALSLSFLLPIKEICTNPFSHLSPFKEGWLLFSKIGAGLVTQSELQHTKSWNSKGPWQWQSLYPCNLKRRHWSSVTSPVNNVCLSSVCLSVVTESHYIALSALELNPPASNTYYWDYRHGPPPFLVEIHHLSPTPTLVGKKVIWDGNEANPGYILMLEKCKGIGVRLGGSWG
jgi:hypothetical protein